MVSYILYKKATETRHFYWEKDTKSSTHKTHNKQRVINGLDPVPLGTDRKVMFVSSWKHTCVILDTLPGPVKCFGENDEGQLGTINETTVLGEYVGDHKGEMGEGLAEVDLPGLAYAVVTGEYHTCAVLDNPKKPVVCWGGNNYFQLGLEDDSVEKLGDVSERVNDDCSKEVTNPWAKDKDGQIPEWANSKVNYTDTVK